MMIFPYLFLFFLHDQFLVPNWTHQNYFVHLNSYKSYFKVNIFLIVMFVIEYIQYDIIIPKFFLESVCKFSNNVDLFKFIIVY